MNLKTRLLALIFSLLTLVGFGQTKILYYVDLTFGTDRIDQALAGLGAGYTITTATDPTDFQTKIPRTPTTSAFTSTRPTVTPWRASRPSTPWAISWTVVAG